MSRSCAWSSHLAILALATLSACRYESPVAPSSEGEIEEVPAAEQASRQAVLDEYIVIFHDDRKIPPGLARQLAADYDLQVKHEYEHVFEGFAARIPPQALDGLRNNPFIEAIEPNLVYQLETPVAASPIEVPLAGLRVRLLADDLGPGEVAVWPNRGSERDATQTDAARRPTYLAPSAAFAGHAAVGFNEGGDNDEVLEIPDIAWHSSSTIIAVVRQQDTNRHNYGLATLYGGRNSRASVVTRAKRGGDVEYWDSGSGWSNGSEVLIANQTYVVAWTIEAGESVNIQVDGTAAGGGALSGSIPNFDRYLIGMTEPSTKSRFDGWIAEILIYDRPLGNCERDELVSELGTFYGVELPIGFGCGGSPPADPSDLAATAVGYDAIDLAWTDNSVNEDGFRIERRQGQAGSWQEIASTGPDVTTFEDSGLAPDSEYCYRLQSFNGSGLSSFSGESCAFTEALPPPPPPIAVPTAGLRLRLIANDLVPGDVTTWPNRGSESDATQPNADRLPTMLGSSSRFDGHAAVEFNAGSDNDEALEVQGPAHHGSGTLIAVFSQDDATSHNYGIFGTYGSGSSRSGMVTRASSTNNGVDYWDSTNGWVSGSTILAEDQAYVGTWRVAAGETVDLTVDGEPAGSMSIGTGFPGFDRYVIGMTEPSTSTRFDGQIAEILFYDRALANCELEQIVADLGAQYGVAVAVTGGTCAPPADPSDLAATAVGYDAIDLAWTDNSVNEDGFRIERRQGQAGSWQEIASTGPDVTTFEDSGLAPDSEYCYRLQSFNGSGLSSFSGESCAFTEALPPPPPPIAVPTAGLRLRLIANDLVPGDVTTWPNRGSESDATQPNADRLPTMLGSSSRFDGHAAVEFNAGSDNDEALEVQGPAHHGSGTLIAVFSQDDATSHNYGIFGTYGSGSSRSGMVTRASSTNNGVDYWDSTNGWVSGSTILAEDQAYVGTWRVAAGETVDLTVDGEPAGSMSIGTGFPGFDRYVIGMTEPSTSTRFDGQIAEILFYDRALANCELEQIVADLGAQYGVAVAVTGGTCAPPADPSDLAATAVGYDAIDLAWTDNSVNEDGFRIERRQGQAGSWQEIASTGPDVTTFENRFLIQQTEYCYRVGAFNDDGSSSASDEACAITEAAPPGACVDTGNHDDLSDLYGIQAIRAPSNQIWASTQQPGCEIAPWYFGLDSGVDSDHPDLNIVEALSFVAAEPNHDGEDRNGHGTHTAGSAAARDGNGGVVGVAPGAPIYSFRVCEDGGSCQTADMVAAMDEVMTRKLDNPGQPMVANMSIGGPTDNVIDEALRNSINAGIVYAVAAGNGVLGACIFPNNAANVSPARVGDDEILPNGGSKGNDGLLNGVLTTTSHNASFSDVNCNYGAPVSVAAPGYQVKSTWLNGAYNTISGTSMATPHAAGAALLYLHANPNASPQDVEAAIVGDLLPWTANEQPNASGRLNVEAIGQTQAAVVFTEEAVEAPVSEGAPGRAGREERIRDGAPPRGAERID